MDEPLSAALERSLAAASITDQDQATVALARRQAADIDNGEDLVKLGPHLLATLAALGMTPAARSGSAAQPAASPAVDALADLRRRRAAR